MHVHTRVHTHTHTHIHTHTHTHTHAHTWYLQCYCNGQCYAEHFVVPDVLRHNHRRAVVPGPSGLSVVTKIQAQKEQKKRSGTRRVRPLCVSAQGARESDGEGGGEGEGESESESESESEIIMLGIP